MFYLLNIKFSLLIGRCLYFDALVFKLGHQCYSIFTLTHCRRNLANLMIYFDLLIRSIHLTTNLLRYGLLYSCVINIILVGLMWFSVLSQMRLKQLSRC